MLQSVNTLPIKTINTYKLLHIVPFKDILTMDWREKQSLLALMPKLVYFYAEKEPVE